MIFKLFKNEDIYKHNEAFKEHVQEDDDRSQSTVSKLVGNMVSNVSDVDVGADVYNDIEMFTAYRDIPGASTIFDAINKTYTLGGSLWLKDVLKHPVFDKARLVNRHKELREFENVYTPKAPQVTTLLGNLKSTEQDVLWFFSASDEELRYLYDIVYFQSFFLAPLNGSNIALTAYNIYRIILSPLTGILSPIIYFVVPYLVLVYKYNINIGFIEYMSFTIRSLILGSNILSHLNGGFAIVKYLSMLTTALFYFQNIFNSFDLSTLLWKLVTKIYTRTNKVFQFLSNSQELLGIFGKSSPVAATTCKKDYCKLWVFDNFGKQLSYFRQTPRPQLEGLLRDVYEIDYKACIMNLLSQGFCYAKPTSSTTPTFSCQGIWHPSILNAVPNDLQDLRNTIITGPNAGGKSTLLKAVLSNIILAQTIGVTSAKEFIFAPFKHISSQISIPDCKGKESLFQAEMFRCKDKLDIAKSLPEGAFMFIAMDEIFNSTNPLEAIAGAFAVLKKLSEYPNVILMITTHFLYLTKLKEHGFDCKKMNVKKHDHTFVFPYKLQKGISRQHVALELLAKNGFDSDLLTTALEIKGRLDHST